MANTMQDVFDFAIQRAEFVDHVTGLTEEAVAKIQQAADQVDAARSESEALVHRASTMEFAIAKASDAKEKQRCYLADIEEISKKIQRYRNQPDMVALLQSERGALYKLLSNTYTDAIKDCVPIEQNEAEELRALLVQATLDGESRKKKAVVLAAAVQVSKVAFRLATKVATA